MSSLYVLLPLEPASAHSEFAYVLSPDGRSVAAQATTTAALLPAPSGAGAEVVAIAPAHALSWHRADLPRGVQPASARLRSVLEGLLEDQLLDDVDQVHFAVQPDARAGAPVWVAVCQRTWLRNALQALESAGRPANRVVPEVAPETPGGLHLIGEPEQAQLIAHGPEGVLMLPLSPGATSLLPALPEDAPCFAEPALAAQAEQLLQRPVVLQSAPQRWLQAAQSRWDLAQFELASSGRTRAMKKVSSLLGEVLRARQWRPARWGAALLVLANLVGVNAWAWRERALLQAKQDEVRATLTRTFPQVRVVVDAPVQMERELASLRQATGASSDRDLETLLTVLAGLSGERTASSIDYTGTELRVAGLGLTEAQVRDAQPALRSQGLVAQLNGDVLVIAPEARP
ncbi:general secretion pathway protein GspL [Ramlibacter sp. AW1]|uniref:General secretion pathway protein GspL n=1 Tax=Ramlibacter aurantiacus TaxID=2801330 RepID=A0A936ZJZ4_9BURK|nr:type II secretion system protein GspL [Ramlibacter aurantiacus]MBL0422739.1 general secretion pathway protein GspL [Ramlibacter aurantiacus]